MKIKLAIPKNKVFDRLIKNVENSGLENELIVYRVEETQCFELLNNHRVDIAFLSPLAYGFGVGKSDFQIIPGPALISNGYTKLASIFFKKGSESIKKVASTNPDDFLTVIGSIILAEKFDIHINLEKSDLSKEEILKDFDAAILPEASLINDNALDIGEEWFDTFELPLPLGFWVCRANEFDDKIIDLIHRIAIDDIKRESHIREDENIKDKYYPRNGKLVWYWTEDIKEALEQVLHFLYFHQFIDEIPEVKIFGSNDEEEKEIKK